MKVRNGLVSNSSSSSFIVEFPKKPESKEELAGMMGDCSPTYCSGDMCITADDVVGTVWGEIAGGQAKSLGDMNSDDFDEIAHELDYYHFDGDICSLVEGLRLEDQHDSISKEIKELLIRKFKETHAKEGAWVATFEYGDDYGDYFCSLEHGNIFRNLPHKKISNH